MSSRSVSVSGCLAVWLSGCLACWLSCSPSRILVPARVTDAETGRPLPGALVTVRSSEMMAAADSLGATPDLEMNPADTVLVTHPGYIDELAAVRRRADTLRLALYEDRERAVAGLVRSTSGFGIDSAVVALDGGQGAATLADGSFFLQDFPAGPRLLTVTCPGFPAESLAVSARAGETLRVTITLRDSLNEGTLNGTVGNRATGEPVPGAGIAIPALGRRTPADAGGRYDFGRVPVGEHLVKVTAEGFATDSVRCRVTRGWAVSVDILLDRLR